MISAFCENCKLVTTDKDAYIREFDENMHITISKKIHCGKCGKEL